MLALLLATTLTAPKIPPLFVPPKGMVRVSSDPVLKRVVRSAGGSVLAAYRGIELVKPSWSRFTYKLPVSITIVRYPSRSDAVEWGLEELQRLGVPPHYDRKAALAFCKIHHCMPSAPPQFHRLASHALRLCGGRTGWMNVFDYTAPRLVGNIVRVDAFAHGHGVVYGALLRYQLSAGDRFHATASLSTLCPPGARSPSMAQVPVLPFVVPRGWTRGPTRGEELPGDPFKSEGYWYRLDPGATQAQWLRLMAASDTSEYITPQEDAQTFLSEVRQSMQGTHVVSNAPLPICRSAEGWLIAFTVPLQRAGTQVQNVAYAYGNDTSYSLAYTRSAALREDPGAMTALRSLCPPLAAPGVPAPSPAPQATVPPGR